MAAVEVSGLVVRYGKLTVVDGVDLEVQAGEVVGLLGPNGAGKTTTVETIEGYRKPAAGRIRVLGLDPVADHAKLVRRIGVMLQKGGVYPGMGPAEALRLFASYYEAPADPRALLETVGLAAVAKTPWRRLSGGEQQRLSLALALVGQPEVAFLDEPTAGVDPHGRLVIREIVRTLRDSGVAVLLTTHELEEAERLSDRIVIIDRGRVVASGTSASIRSLAGGREIRFGAPPGLAVADLASALSAPVREEHPGEYVVSSPATPSTIAALTAWLAERDLPLSDLRAGRESLEDVFLRLTARASRAADARPPEGTARGSRTKELR